MCATYKNTDKIWMNLPAFILLKRQTGKGKGLYTHDNDGSSMG